MDDIRSLYSLAASGFYTTHACAIDIIKGVQNDIPLIIENCRKPWEENGKLEINVDFSLLLFY